VSYRPQVNLCGHHPINIKTSFTERWRVTPENLQEALTHKKHESTVCILNYPGNPDGLAYTKEEMIELTKVLTE
jgi:aspartate/methionine/tyrosine aminotransferase